MDNEQKYAAFTLAIVLLRAASRTAHQKGDRNLVIEADRELSRVEYQRDRLMEVHRG